MPEQRPSPPPPKPQRKTLAAVLGTTAAIGLMVATPMEESGRTVTAAQRADGSIAVTHVKGHEYLKAYLDIVGVPTACDGITKGVKLGQTYTEAQCAQLLEDELVVHATAVMGCTAGLGGEGHDNERIAAVLLAYNVGGAGYCHSTVRARFNTHNYAGACDAFAMWNKAGGRVVAGLTARRAREAAICRKDLAPHPVVAAPPQPAPPISAPAAPPQQPRKSSLLQRFWRWLRG